MGLFGTDRSSRMLARIEELSEQLALTSGQLVAKEEQLGIATEYEAAKKQYVDLQVELSRVKEQHEREKREIEHKIGLHKLQVAQERESAIKEAQLAVREEALAAQKDQFKEQMGFMQDRFESEVASQRVLVNQVLERLPKFERTYSTVEHIGTDPRALESGEGS